MDAVTFWAIVQEANEAASSCEERPDALRAVLEKLAPEDIQAFHEQYIATVYAAYSWPLWGAAYVINGGCSDDGFDYFRDWLISEGQTVFEAALANPESLADLDDAPDEFELETFRYVAGEVFEAKAGRAMDARLPPFPGEPTGEPWDEDTVDKQYPRLAEKYW